MTNELKELLAELEASPERTAQGVNAGVNSFAWPAAVITDREQYKECLAAFYCHIESALLCLRRPRSPSMEFDLGRCTDLMKKAYGENALHTGFALVRTGNEGGLRGLLNTVATLFLDESIAREARVRVTVYRNSLPPEVQAEDAVAYASAYGHLYPTEMNEGGGAKIMVSFFSIIEEHGRHVNALRQVGRTFAKP